MPNRKPPVILTLDDVNFATANACMCRDAVGTTLVSISGHRKRRWWKFWGVPDGRWIVEFAFDAKLVGSVD